MESIALLIGGLGIGSLITSLATHFFTRRAAIRDRLYAEKREAYLGLLNALHQAAVSPSDQNAKNYALWQTRCELFGSRDVATFAQSMVDTNDGPSEARGAAHRGLIDSMKADLRRSA